MDLIKPYKILQLYISKSVSLERLKNFMAKGNITVYENLAWDINMSPQM